jgi:hypothetical protein
MSAEARRYVDGKLVAVNGTPVVRSDQDEEIAYLRDRVRSLEQTVVELRAVLKTGARPQLPPVAPAPVPSNRMLRGMLGHIRDLVVGESFIVREPGIAHERLRGRINPAVRTVKAQTGRTFRVTKVEERTFRITRLS